RMRSSFAASAGKRPPTGCSYARSWCCVCRRWKSCGRRRFWRATPTRTGAFATRSPSLSWRHAAFPRHLRLTATSDSTVASRCSAHSDRRADEQMPVGAAVSGWLLIVQRRELALAGVLLQRRRVEDDVDLAGRERVAGAEAAAV